MRTSCSTNGSDIGVLLLLLLETEKESFDGGVPLEERP